MSTIRSMSTVLAAAAVVAFAAGCPKKESASAPSGSAATVAPEAPVAAKGLNAKDNDPQVVALVKKVLGDCADKWDTKKAFDECQDPMKALREAKLEKKDATCLNLLEDEDVKVRYLGATCLSYFGWDYRTERTTASRLVDALEREKAPSPIDTELAYLATGIYESAGMNDRLGKILTAPGTAKDVKLLLASWWRSPQSYDALKGFLDSGDPKLVLAALQGYAVHFDKHATEACAAWAAHFEDADKEARRQAVGHLTGGWSGNNAHDDESNWYVTGGGGGPSRSGDAWCTQIDDALAKIQARTAANTVDDSVYVYALENVAKHAKATAAQKKKAVSMLETIASTKGASQRSFAITRLVDVDASKKAFVAKLAKDPDVKYTVENALKAKSK